MRYRRLGRTGLRVSEIGLGGWGIGKQMWAGTDDRRSLAALEEAARGGLNFIDTAPVYGRGHSERLIGRFLRRCSARVFVASKIPPRNFRWPAQGRLAEAFPAEHIVKSTETSLANLGVERLDLMQLHVWNPDWRGQDQWLEALTRLRAQGKIGHFGVSVNDHQPASAVELVQSGQIDIVQVIYNIFDQSPEDELFEVCQKHDVGVIARVPFDEGALTGKVTPQTVFPPKDWRNLYFQGDRKQQVFKRIEALKPLLSGETGSLPELALKFCLHHPAVSTVIPGMRSPEHVRSNLKVSDQTPLSPAAVAALRAHRWERNFYPVSPS